MASTSRVKEEFYLQRMVCDDVPVFVDATRYARQGIPYPLSTKKALKATCAVRADDEVVAFSLRDYTARQAEREVEHLRHAVGGTTLTERNVLRPRMPRKTLRELTRTARAVSAALSDDMVAELAGHRYVLTIAHRHRESRLRIAGELIAVGGHYVRSDIDDIDPRFMIPPSGVRLRVFLRSPVRQRVIAYAFGGYLTRKPGECVTVTHAAALALNSVLQLAPFRMLSGLERIEVPPASGHAAVPSRDDTTVAFSVPVLLSTDDGSPAAEGRVDGEIDLERLDPMTGGLCLHLRADRLTWDPAALGTVRFEAYRPVLAKAIGELIDASLGADCVRDIAYAIALGELVGVDIAALCAATSHLPLLAAAPEQAKVLASPPETTRRVSV
jgi:hypothetical protein